VPAAYFVWAAGVFDYFDGFVARLLKVSSPIGKELDSLADVVSFGVLPALVMYKLIGEHTTSEALPYIAFSIAAFSALRLAIFNIDETQTDSFKGLNTPANTLLFSLLLVSRIEIFALKFKNFTWADNKLRFTFLLLAVVLLALFQITAIPFIILLYIGLSLGAKAFSK
jgi:CDP-diacylglycerol--serine O-phosphatidyltransferase